MLIGIEPASLSTAPVGTKDGDQRFRRLRLASDENSTLGDNGGVYIRPSGAVTIGTELSSELSKDIEPPSLSTAPGGTKGGD